MGLGEMLLTDTGSKFRISVKLMESGQARTKLISIRTAAPKNVYFSPAVVMAYPHITPPKAIAPCETTMAVAFIRPRAQPGMARCAASQSSAADRVHPTPASAAKRKKASRWCTTAINRYRSNTNRFANIVSVFGRQRALSHGTITTAAMTEPPLMLVSKRPRPDGLRYSTFMPITGISAGIAEMHKANRAFRANTIWSPDEYRA